MVSIEQRPAGGAISAPGLNSLAQRPKGFRRRQPPLSIHAVATIVKTALGPPPTAVRNRAYAVPGPQPVSIIFAIGRCT